MSQETLSDAARRAYEAARRAFEDAPEVEAHAWRGTLAKRAAAQGDAGSDASFGSPVGSAGFAGPVESAAAGQSALGSRGGAPASGRRAVRPTGAVRAENEDDDGYDPWSDRRPVDSFWEEDPWR